MSESIVEEARRLDEDDLLKTLREEFIIPSKLDLKRELLVDDGNESSSSNPSLMQGLVSEDSSSPAIYLCGNSLGLQPRRLHTRIESHLKAWATKGVLGHFFQHEKSPQPPFLHLDAVAAEKMAPLVGALPSEIAVMETLTANLHLLMSSFYRPTKERYQILIEGKAFPSDHYVVESQIIHLGFDPANAMVLIEPPDPSEQTVPTSHVLSMIDKHASTAALILLPGIQYYTGQYFDIKSITEYAHSKGILIGWDLAHAVGNMELCLHEWNIDFAVWCNYKYLNAGPGAIAALFVHEVHGVVGPTDANGVEIFRPRLCGWWGGDKKVRFDMGNRFIPIPGAAGYQVGNPSALALTAVLASLELFNMTDMSALRAKSIRLTSYLERLLLHDSCGLYRIITPKTTTERGAQLSILLQPGLLNGVMAILEESGIVVDERKPDVIRVAPAPMYNTFQEVFEFVRVFQGACRLKATEISEDAGHHTSEEGLADGQHNANEDATSSEAMRGTHGC